MKKEFLFFLLFWGVLTSVSPAFAEENPLSTFEGLKAALEGKPSSVIVVDVRSEYLFSQGHIKGAVNVPLYSLLVYKANPPDLRDLSATLVVVGRPVSPEAYKGCDLLKLRGFKDVVLFGPISKWKGELVR